MTDPILLMALLLVIVGAAALGAGLSSRRVHNRRVQARLQESIHLYAVVRAFFAERRHPI